MKPLSYTSTHQLTYLFMEVSLGRLTNPIVNDSLQAFLADLEESISSGDGDSNVVKESIIDYALEQYISETDAKYAKCQYFISQIMECTARILGDVPEKIKDFYTNILKELNEAIKEEN